MIFTLAAAVYLYVYMHEYSIFGSKEAKIAERNEGITESNRVDVPPDTEVRPTESLELERQPNRARPTSPSIDLD